MESKDIQLLNRVYQDAQTGMQSIDKVLKKLEDDNLKKLFKKQFEEYEKFADRCDAIALSKDKDVKNNSLFKKIKQSAMVYVSLWFDKSPRHIVEMMINGTVMGIIDTIKIEADFAPRSEELKTLVADFKKMQEEFYEKLKKQLSKV